MESEDKDSEQEIGTFLIPNIQDYCLLNIADDQEEFISLNETGTIINNLDIKKTPRIHQTFKT